MATLKALVVDDASFVRDLVKRTVRQRFPVIDTTDAQNGRRAQSLMSRTTFDLILCDWEMPEMSGLELLQWMRQQPQYEKTPFIMITSRGDKDHVVEAVKGGVSEYLGKPFSPEGLSNKIIKVMGRRLKDAMDRGGKSMAGPAEAFRESASLLTQKREAASPAPVRASKSSTSSASGSTARPPMSVASVRFSDSTLRSVVKDITLTEVRVIAKRDQQFPGILDQAVVDIEVSEGQVARLNGYVHQLQAVDKRQDTDFVGVTIRFVDEDPKKLEDLSRFIARFRSGG
ncbi:MULTISPECIES: response regulator [Marinobacter]|jgi:CheY-like chemotaxis protein|uniref:response regulator n=1 Tax=Marinobacter TaxID=2742 RepID=UPI0009489072|nr:MULTISPECIES: response regulator [Marinobacter]MCZ4283902.1 response regulator [Marinobacter salarius]MDC8456776.1 response regulator [Marinobacter sp. DS40M6]OLF85441.1 two-component system response regulator [Marinobacter sp. C18]VVT22254.1 Two-component system response regulator [Marinobacter salarius]VXB72523.1 Chemotaxis regulator - transmits chemoreceptor signals to flagelllar motor components CheY [Marinobacter salarius]|tara:strand:- start:11920 stop:12777 length:858 start_codon:yes stop_codon:yes gene_type:complete